MKFIEKVALIIFSIVTLVVSVLNLIYSIGIIGNREIKAILELLSTGRIGIGVLIFDIIMILLAIKSLFFSSKVKRDKNDGILLENANGKLLITRDTLESMVNSVTRNIGGAESISSRVAMDKDNNLFVIITITVAQDVNIKDLSNNVQVKVKEIIKQTADLDVKEVNVKIKNINIKTREEKIDAINENYGGNNE